MALAHEALAFIARLYQIEARAKDHPPDERGRMRQGETVPLLGFSDAYIASTVRRLWGGACTACLLLGLVGVWRRARSVIDESMSSENLQLAQAS